MIFKEKESVELVNDYISHPEFEEMRNKINDCGSDDLPTFGGTFVGGYNIQQAADEFASLCLLLKDKKSPIKLYGEIGSASGGNLRFVHENIGFTEAMTADNQQHPKHGYQPENFKAFDSTLKKFAGDSHSDDFKNFLKETYGDRKFDVLFIDGDHTYEGLCEDIEMMLPYGDEETYYIFHDTVACANAVGKAVQKYLDNETFVTIGHFVSRSLPVLGIAVCKKIKK